MLNRVNILLLIALIACALMVVTSQHKARSRYIELRAEQDTEQKLDNEWRELQIEAETLGAGKRIGQRATKELAMSQPDAKKAVIVVLETAPASVPPITTADAKSSVQK
jgi:cell division protein FtsL